MELHEAIKMTRNLMNAHNLRHWNLEARNFKAAFGKCSYRKQTISLSAILTPNCTEDSVRNTALHEIAHALVGYAHAHDHVWRRQFIAIGGNGERTGGDDNYINGRNSAIEVQEKYFTYKGVCPNGHKVYRNRKPKGQSSCSLCCRRFNPDFLITWTRNM